jgi:hypothetical protein
VYWRTGAVLLLAAAYFLHRGTCLNKYNSDAYRCLFHFYLPLIPLYHSCSNLPFITSCYITCLTRLFLFPSKSNLPTCTATRNTYLHASFPPKRRTITGPYGVTTSSHCLPTCTTAEEPLLHHLYTPTIFTSCYVTPPLPSTNLYGVTTPLHCLPTCTTARGAYPPPSPYANNKSDLPNSTTSRSSAISQYVRRHKAIAQHVHVISS